MAKALVDTSAIIALLSPKDDHASAAVAWASREDLPDLVIHDHVVGEATALLHERLGPAAARAFLVELLPSFVLISVDVDTLMTAITLYLGSLRRRASLVDSVSFEVMRRQEIDTAFTFDRDFARAGFKMVP